MIINITIALIGHIVLFKVKVRFFLPNCNQKSEDSFLFFSFFVFVK